MNKLDRNIKLVFAMFCVLFISLIVYLTYFTVYERDRLVQSTYNRRLWEQEEKVMRGTIYDIVGRPLAESGVDKEVKKRIYPGKSATGPLIGYNDKRLGRAGMESVLNGELLGLSQKDPMALLRQKILGVSDRGNDVYLTIDLELQKLAYELFRGRRGALAALDPKTGAVLALVSSPGFDSSQLHKNWDSLVNNPVKPLINRATQGLYPPGSSFKIITLAAALTNNPEIENKVYHTPGYVKVKGSIIHDYEGFEPGDYDIAKAFRRSSNSVFIQIGQDVGGEKVFDMAETFGFNSSIQADVPTAVSKFPKPPLIGGEVEYAEDSIGQGKILATPLQMARVAAVVANGGELIKPYVIHKVVSPLGKIKVYEPSKGSNRILEHMIAEKLKWLMVDVVKNGTGRSAQIKGITVAGKTGSAENPHGKAHAWFVGFAPAEDPKIAVAVVVENAGSGGGNAGPIAREVMLKYLNLQ
jgi:peptidoglycan glycosyltransferase